MKNLSIILFLWLLTTTLMQCALTRAPEDFMGQVPIPSSIEVEVLKFKTDQIVFAGTNGDGIYVSYDGGTNWAKLSGFPAEFQCVKDILITDNKDIYAATFGGGIYYSNDKGATWVPKNTGLKNLFVQALAVTKTGKLLCGTYTGGVYYSDDNGSNWIRTDKGLCYDNVTCLTVMNNGFILAGTYGGGFYVSRDTCKTWLVSNTELKNIFINDLVKDESGKVYAATNGAGVMFTGDGITWTRYSNRWRKEYDGFSTPLLDTAVTAVGAFQYQMLMGTRSAGMYYWNDLWNCWQNSGDLGVGITACAASPNGTILEVRSYCQVVRSTDNGTSWFICSKNIANMHVGELDDSPTPVNIFAGKYLNSIVSVTNFGKSQKLFISEDHGNSWKYLNSIAATHIYDVEITPDSTIYIASDGGLHRYSKINKTFESIFSMPSEPDSIWGFKEVKYNPVSKSIFAIYELMEPVDSADIPPPPTPWSRVEYKIYRTDDLGHSWTILAATKSGDTFPGIHNINCELNGDIYVNIKDEWTKSTNNGNTFDDLAFNLYRYTHGNDGNLYYYDLDEKIWVQKNKTGKWTQIPFEPELYFDGCEWQIQNIGASKNGDFYVSLKIVVPYQGMMYELYKTTDYGQNWQTMKGCYNMDLIRTISSDNNGYTYFVSNALYKVLNPQSLVPPVPIAPINNNMGEETNPLFVWKHAPLAEEYELQIDQDDTFFSPFEYNVTGDTTVKAVLDLYSNTEYAWRLRSKTHSARSDWQVSYFTVGLEPPKLISPEKGKVGVPLNAVLLWHNIEDATHYQIQVAEDENFDKIVYNKQDYTDTTIITDKLNGLNTYYWRVKAFTKDNVSRWSEVWNFRTVTGPPKLIYPENNSIDKQLTEQFRWNKSPEAQSYYIQVAKDSSFTDFIFDGNADADTFKVIGNMLPETDYFWHVASVNADGKSDYSDIWTFRTSLKPIELTYPENQKVNVALDTKFTWLEHNSGSQYQIQISKSADFIAPVVDQKVNNVLEFQTNKLEYYKDYFWRVRLVIGNRYSLWSEVWKFKTGIQSANLLNPPDKSSDQPTTIKFKWYEVAGVKFYQLQISKNDLFTDLVYSMDSLTASEQYVENMEPEKLYYWRVRAWNDESFGTSQWSDIWTFTTGKVTMVLRSPKTGSTGVNIPSVLLWYPATSAQYYHLQVAKDANFANIIFDKDSIYDTKWTLTPTDIAVNTDYYWHVKAICKQYTIPWSETWHFITASTSIKESEIFSSIKLYPNPTDNCAELSIDYPETCSAKILITTANGKIVKSEIIHLSQGNTRYKINTEHLNSGSYYITIITPSGYITRELVVVR